MCKTLIKIELRFILLTQCLLIPHSTSGEAEDRGKEKISQNAALSLRSFATNNAIPASCTASKWGKKHNEEGAKKYKG